MVAVQLLRPDAGRPGPDPARLRGARLHQWLVLRGGITLERGLLDWYDQVLTALSRKGRS